jgi:hypothetical protein
MTDKKYVVVTVQKKIKGVRGDTPRIRCEFISLFVIRPDYRDGSI